MLIIRHQYHFTHFSSNSKTKTCIGKSERRVRDERARLHATDPYFSSRCCESINNSGTIFGLTLKNSACFYSSYNRACLSNVPSGPRLVRSCFESKYQSEYYPRPGRVDLLRLLREGRQLLSHGALLYGGLPILDRTLTESYFLI